MINPFFKNHGPFSIIEILKCLDIKHIDIRTNKEDICDIKDLYTSTKKNITFFHSKKYKDIANKTEASYCITTDSLKNELPKNCIPLIVKNVLVSTSIITSKFYPESIHDNYDDTVNDIAKTEFKKTVKFGKNVLLGTNVKIGSNCSICHNTII